MNKSADGGLPDLHTHATLAVRMRKQKFSTIIQPQTRHTIFGEETTFGR